MRDDQRPGGDVDADGAEQGLEARRPARRRRPRPTDRGDARRRRPASSSTEREHLAAAGADGPQQGQLTDPLGDDDGEGVVDDEDADEQGDEGEGQQEGVEEAQVLG